MSFSEHLANATKRELRDSRFQSLQTHRAGKGGRVFYVLKTAATNYPQFAEDHPDYKSADGVVTTAAVYNTIDAAVGACTADQGDVIYVMPGHTETISGASGVAQDIAGVEIIGLGVGNNRPVITFSAVASTWVVSANNCSVENIVGVASIDLITNPFLISGNNCKLDIEWQDGSSTVEALRAIRLDTADNAVVKLRFNGFTAGDATVNAVRLDDCDNVRIEIDAYGRVDATGWVEMVDVASTNVKVTGTFYASGVTTLARNVVDTITGSTWMVDGFDAAAGAPFSGGSGNAVAIGDLSVIASSVLVPSVDSTANVDVADVVGNKTDAAIADTIEGAAATTQSLLADVKAVLQRIGADSANNTAATTLVAVNKDGSIFERLEDISQELSGTAGIATFPAAAAPANAVSIAEVLREQFDQADKSVSNSTAVLANGTTLFTITGGPIEILSLVARCATTNDGTASTLQWSADPTDGVAVTISAASASLASVAAGGMVVFQGTTLATAPLVSASGANIGQAVTNGVVVGAGIITSVVGAGSTTGTWQMHMRYRPLARGVTVS